MNVQQALEYINGTSRFGSKPGLEIIGLLMEKLGNPQDDLKFIHVAGTTAKGPLCIYRLRNQGY